MSPVVSAWKLGLFCSFTMHLGGSDRGRSGEKRRHHCSLRKLTFGGIVCILVIVACLCIINGPGIVQKKMSESDSMKWKFMNQKIQQGDKEVLVDLVKTFKKVADNLNLTYFMIGGTLIGSWRHHGMIAWDDDVDILVDIGQKSELLDAIKELEPDYFGPDTYPVIKFYSRNSTLKITGRKWRWPFIDICFFDQNKSVIWDTLGDVNHIKLSKEKIFPLHKRPFEQLQLNAPKDSLYFLRKTYGGVELSNCKTNARSHRLEQPAGRRYSINCEALKDLVPFVHRRVINGTMEETLKLGEKVVHVKIVQEDPRILGALYAVMRA